MKREIDGLRIDEGTVTVEWQEPHRLVLAIGRKQCSCCGEWTPVPSESVLIRLYRDETIDAGTSTVWPFEHWQPPGWMQTPAGTFCVTCSLCLKDFMDERSRAKRGMRDLPDSRPAGHASALKDAEVARIAIGRAIDLADDGLVPKHYNVDDKYKRLLQIVNSIRAVLRGESA